MIVHCLMHVPFEGPAMIAQWAAARGFALQTWRVDRGELPRPEAGDRLVVLGGPMGVGDQAEHPWLGLELEFLCEQIAAQRRILGICLGAQLLAAALGARVMRQAEAEIGWFTLAADPAGLALGLPPRCTAFHWHGETFALPTGAVRLAHSAACANQGFVWADRIFGLQFHLEVTPAAIAGMCTHCAGDLVPGRWIQADPAQLADPTMCTRANALAAQVLDRCLAPAPDATRSPPTPAG
ncbi:MAG: type 1 glutamine amidotransferase [Planctomycetota bacterium]